VFPRVCARVRMMDVPALIRSLNLACFLACIKNNPVPTIPYDPSYSKLLSIFLTCVCSRCLEVPSPRTIHSKFGLLLIRRMDSFHKLGRSVQKVRSLGRVVKAWASDDIGPSSSKSSWAEWCNLAVDGEIPESSESRKATSASSKLSQCRIALAISPRTYFGLGWVR